jgi:hypothetical protein
MTGARQTLLSWARVIDSFETVPDIYKNPYQALVGNTGALPYTVLAPAQGAFRGRKSRERLLCEISDMFYVLERAGAEVFTTGYRSRDICSFEVGNILLYSWFSISGRTNAGAEAASTVEFNEATLRHFEPFFCKMRPAPTGLDQPDPEVEEAKFDYLSTQNFKFMNFARASLAPGERVIQSLYQPRNRQSVIKVLGRNIYRTISPAHLTILTDKEVILIGDVEGIAENKRSRYGGVRRYLPLRSIVSVALQEQPNDLLSFTFNVSPNVQVERLFDAAHLREIDNLKKALETLFG